MILPVVGDIAFPFCYGNCPQGITGKREAQALGCGRMDRCADQTSAILSHLHDMTGGYGVRPDSKICLSFPVVKIIQQNKLPVTQRCQSIIYHGPTSTVTVSVSSTPSFRRSATGAITSIISSG